MKNYIFRLDDTTINRLNDIHYAMAKENNRYVTYGTYSERHNGLNRTDTLRAIIDQTWQRLNDEGKIVKDRRQLKCSKCDGFGHMASQCPWID